jgi:hypothetical protein
MRQWRRRQDLPRGEMAQGMLAVRISIAYGSAYIATTTVSFTLAALHNLVVEGKRLHEVPGEGVLVAGHIMLLLCFRIMDIMPLALAICWLVFSGGGDREPDLGAHSKRRHGCVCCTLASFIC